MDSIDVMYAMALVAEVDSPRWSCQRPTYCTEYMASIEHPIEIFVSVRSLRMVVLYVLDNLLEMCSLFYVVLGSILVVYLIYNTQ